MEPSLGRYNRSAVIAGLIFVALGVVFLLEALNVFDLRAAYVWPVILIAIGGAIVASGLASSRKRQAGERPDQEP
jgi:cell wall-active antibiotic response 4TMS protein YvqF